LTLAEIMTSKPVKYRESFGSATERDLLKDIRYSFSHRLVLGTKRFKTR
jgi:hypothetical protein